MDCKHTIKKGDWDKYYKKRDSGFINEKISYSIYDYKSIVLHITDKNFRKNIENILSEYRKSKKLYYQYFIDNIMNNYDNSYYIYLHHKNKIIGMSRAGVRNKKVEISMVFISSIYRKKSYAYKMLDIFINFLNDQVDVVKIGLSVEKENKNAYKLYNKLNFKTECEISEELIDNDVPIKYNIIYMYL